MGPSGGKWLMACSTGTKNHCHGAKWRLLCGSVGIWPGPTSPDQQRPETLHENPRNRTGPDRRPGINTRQTSTVLLPWLWSPPPTSTGHRPPPQLVTAPHLNWSPPPTSTGHRPPPQLVTVPHLNWSPPPTSTGHRPLPQLVTAPHLNCSPGL
ncbi:hypothetical protein ACOMHN_002534 [Nucella lapillus]